MTVRLTYICGYLLGVAALTACSNSDVPEPVNATDYITFGVSHFDFDSGVENFGMHPSRAELTTTLDKFNVWGFSQSKTLQGGEDVASAVREWNDKSIFFTGNTVADVFDNMEVTVTGNFASYDPTKSKKWNENKKAYYSFVAGAGAGTFTMSAANASTGHEHGPQLTYTLPASGGDMDYSKQPDAMVAATFDHQQEDGQVKLSFFHFMTGLRFKFHNHTTDKELVIKKVTFSGDFYKGMQFDFTTDKPTMKVATDANDNVIYYNATFTLLDDDQTITAGSADYMGTDEHPVTFLLLPNPNATMDESESQVDDYALGRNKVIDITYTIGGGDERHFTLGGEAAAQEFRLNYIPEPNTLHTAHFNFVGDEFMVVFQANNEQNWGNGSDNNVDIN